MPIFTLKVERELFSLDTIYNLSAHKATPGAECALSHYSGDDSSLNFQSELDSAQDESNSYCPETVSMDKLGFSK